MRTAALLSLALSLATFSSAAAAEIESAFFAENLKDPIEIAPAADGDIYIVEREGRVLRLRPSTGGLFVIGELEVTALRAKDKDSSWAREDGILGLALDPGFAKNQRLYIYYSHPKELLNRLSRFQLKDGKLDLASEKVLFDVKTDRRDRVCHHGGSLAFGPGGLLYLSTGDNTNPFESDGFAPLDDRDGHEHANAMRSAGNTNDLRGKVLRVKPTENGYEIPPGNLFPKGTPKTRPEIYTMGLRNPYRLSIDWKANVLYWGEVGPDAANDGAKGPRGYDEVNQAKKAGNFGWPFVIGNNWGYSMADYEAGRIGPVDPKAPKNPSKHNTGLVDLPPANPAFVFYPYGESNDFPSVGKGGRNAMAGPVFYYDSRKNYNFLDKEDDHSLLTYDWIRNKMWKVKLGADEQLMGFGSVMGGLKHPMDLEMGPDGTLWMLEYGTEWYFNTDGRVRRLRPEDGNKPPVITAKREVEGNTFTASASDPEGDAPHIDWWLTEGVSERKIGSGPTLVVSTAGGSELRAVATDAKGEVAIARIPLKEEAAAPALELEFAKGEANYGFGEDLAFKVTGDAEAAKVVVRARYIPPTGHDAGGQQFPADIEKLVIARQCFACHQVEKTSVGPAYLDVAMKYRGDAGVLARLQAKLKTGGGGAWGEIPMPPQVAVNDAEAQQILKAVLNLSSGMAETRGAMEGSLKLSSQPQGVDSGGAWEITAESPGYRAARKRVGAK